MKIVILAAGKGSRLGAPKTPKPLTLLENGKSLLEMQLEAIKQSISLHHVLVVVGYEKEKIIASHPDLLFVYNPDFATENTSKSLLRALYKIDEDLLWLNGDVLVHPSVIADLIAFNQTSMLVNVSPVDEEEVKYCINAQGDIISVSKEIPPTQSRGECLGINLFKREELGSLKQGLEQCNAHDYFEKGIEWAIAQGTIVKNFPTPIDLCMEIDFPEDLQRANQMLKKW